MKKKIYLNKISYAKLIIDLSDEIGISIEETKHLLDAVMTFTNMRKINYKELKEEILTYLVINMFSLICKL